MADSIWFEFPQLPVSVNKLYTVRGGRKILTGAGRKFKNTFKQSMGGCSVRELMSFEADPENAYELTLWFFVPKDKLYFEKYGTDGRIKSPFKDMDATNLIKIAEDCIADLVGLRDRNNFSVSAHKRVAEEPRMVAFFRKLDLEDDPYALDAKRA